MATTTAASLTNTPVSSTAAGKTTKHSTPTAIAANDFFAGYQRGDWKSLAERVRRLCHFFEQQQQQQQQQHGGQQHLPFYILSDDSTEALRIAITASILVACPPHWEADFESLFRASLTFRMKQKPPQLQDDDDNDDDDDQENAPIDNEQEFFRNLQKLGWVRPRAWLERSLCLAIKHCIQRFVQDSIQGDFESADLLDTVILPVVQGVVSEWVSNALMQSLTKVQDEWGQDLYLVAARSFCHVRLQEIFDLVADYPDSLPACQELEHILLSRQIPGLQHALGDALRSALVRRLNHPGANTAQIIDVYINTIQVLRRLDPTDRLLRTVTEPVRTYLRGRSDTVRCIITSLTDPATGGGGGGGGAANDLYQELRRQDAKPLEHVPVLGGDGAAIEEDINDHEDQEGPPTLDWQPPPSIFQPKGTFLSSTGAAATTTTTGPTSSGSGSSSQPNSKSSSNSDLLAMLVSIYGSKDLFVNEYRLMLADKLLANLDYNTDREVHTLELLKLRFGEMSMRNCEVMIKDMDDSKRTNALIKEELQSVPTRSGLQADHQPVVDAAMISHIFWPTLQQESLKHHPRIQADIDEFNSVYGRLKNPRKLIWMNQLGSVQLELDVSEIGLDGAPIVETRSFTCSPLQATLILHFEDKNSWTVEDLANETGVPEHVIQKRMAFWIHHRVVRIVPSATTTTTTSSSHASSTKVAYELASCIGAGADDHRKSAAAAIMDDDEAEDGSSSQQAVSKTAHHEEEMQVYESYIVGMLTNLGQLPIERIHNMLKMFVTGSDVRYDKTPQQLSVFLQHLVKQEKLECGPDGMYRLFRK